MNQKYFVAGQALIERNAIILNQYPTDADVERAAQLAQQSAARKAARRAAFLSFFQGHRHSASTATRSM